MTLRGIVNGFTDVLFVSRSESVGLNLDQSLLVVSLNDISPEKETRQ